MQRARERHFAHNLKKLATLQARHAHSAHGYETGLEGAEAGFAPVFDPDGSWMSMVHETILSVRGLFDTIEEDAIPGIIDGELRVLDQINSVRANLRLMKAD